MDLQRAAEQWASARRVVHDAEVSLFQAREMEREAWRELERAAQRAGKDATSFVRVVL
jgi:predicted kinase